MGVTQGDLDYARSVVGLLSGVELTDIQAHRMHYAVARAIAQERENAAKIADGFDVKTLFGPDHAPVRTVTGKTIPAETVAHQVKEAISELIRDEGQYKMMTRLGYFWEKKTTAWKGTLP